MIKQRNLQNQRKTINSSLSNPQQIFLLNHHNLLINHNLEKPKLIKKQLDHECHKMQSTYIQKKDLSLMKSISTPNDNKTEKNYKPKEIDKQSIDIEFFEIQNNQYQTIKKEKQIIERPRKRKQQDTTKQFQLPGQIKKQNFRTQITNSSFYQRDQQLNIYDGRIVLQSGWLYKGECINNLFHGYGELFHKQKLIYSGQFQLGYFHGYGKIKNCKQFDFLISKTRIVSLRNTKINNHQTSILHQQQETFKKQKWIIYIGQFKKGEVDGFGQLWLHSGQKIISKWKGGKPDKQKVLIMDPKQTF